MLYKVPGLWYCAHVVYLVEPALARGEQSRNEIAIEAPLGCLSHLARVGRRETSVA